MSALRVLIVEDSEDDVLLVVRALKKAGLEPVYKRVETRGAMQDALEKEPWDLIISDHVMPEFDSFQALDVLKRSGLDIPFILVSGSIGEEMAVESMKAGVHDFVMKDKLARLAPAVMRELKEAENRRDKQAAYEALVVAKKAAEAANEAKSTFLANMSHEIRTPLNGIMGLLQLMQGTPLESNQKRFVGLALTSADRLTSLLSDILDICSIDSGRMEVRDDRINLRDVTDSAMDLFSLTAEEKNIRLEGRYDPSIPATLLGDAVRVRQILFNLIGNAVKFTDKGHVHVDIVSVGMNRDNRLRVLISVSDTGVGMPEESLDDLFKPFVQQDSSITRKYQGAGLGLTIVKRLVELMGGNISVESVPDEGSTFHVLLPFTVPQGGSGDLDRPGTWSGERKEGVSILYAEDDPANQITVRLLLERVGHQVAVAEDGQIVLDLLAKNDFDCVLMDVQMPRMDGIQATKAIRNWDSLRHVKDIPIIGLSAKVMPGDRESFLSAGMNDYLAKPVRIEDLEEKVRRHCLPGANS